MIDDGYYKVGIFDRPISIGDKPTQGMIDCNLVEFVDGKSIDPLNFPAHGNYIHCVVVLDNQGGAIYVGVIEGNIVQESSDNCTECGLQISSTRQLAYPGCTLCDECAGKVSDNKPVVHDDRDSY